MKTESHQTPILGTKLHRPSMPADHVSRIKLLERLNKSRHQSVILVSAPAGYGKSTLVSSWLDVCERQSIWLSLDEGDNDLQRFFSYLIAAVNMVAPGAAGETQALIDAATLPPTEVLVATITNELDRIDQDFILVLDDIHHVKEKKVHDILSGILQHPPRCMQLVLVGRRDPMFTIANLRGRGLLVELRINDLRFSIDESIAFLKVAMGCIIDTATTTVLAKKSEGWITGLRLAVLAMEGHRAIDPKLLELKGTTFYVMEYLIREVLDSQPSSIRNYLLRTCILDRFCAPLCNSLCEDDDVFGLPEISGQVFIDKIQKDNLFALSLDTDNQWFRYHHLFQQLLHRQLNQRVDPDTVRSLHDRASRWFASQNLIDEAIEHAIAAGKPENAADIVEKHRLEVLNADQWPVLVRWLAQLPEEIVWQRPELLLSKAWLAYYRFQIPALNRIISRLDELFREGCHRPAWEGEQSMFKAYLCYWQGQSREMLTHVDKAQAGLPSNNYLANADSEIYFGLAHHMAGQEDVAIDTLTRRISQDPDQKGFLLTRQVITLAFIHLLSGRIKEAAIYSQQLGKLALTVSPAYIKSWSTYILGCCHFQAGDWQEAEHCFRWMVDNRYIAHTAAVMSSMTGLALTLGFMGRMRESVEVTRDMMGFAVETKDPDNLALAESGQSRIGLFQGNPEGVGRFSEAATIATAFIFIEVPPVTYCRLLVANSSPEKLTRTIEKICSLEKAAGAIHNTFHLIDLVAMRAIILSRYGRSDEAEKCLEQALYLAEPGGWVRPFIELGSPMADLLTGLRQRNIAVDQIERILNSFRDLQTEHQPRNRHPESKFDQPLIDPLTNRELDVLELLAKRLQNKEIADKLCVSLSTVKTHLRHIYEKMAVNNRRQAIQMAEQYRLF